MKRIILGIVVLGMIFCNGSFYKTNIYASDGISFAKIWETDENEGISFSPTIDKDGNLWGLKKSLDDENKYNLVKISNGKVAWKSDEVFASSGMLVWSILLNEDFVIVAYQEILYNKLPAQQKLNFTAYSTDGQLKWKKSFTQKHYLLTNQLFKGKIWLSYANDIILINPLDGLESKKISFPGLGDVPLGKLTTNGEAAKSDNGLLLAFDDMLVLNQLSKIIALKVTEEYELGTVWERALAKKEGILYMNIMLWKYANPSVLMIFDSDLTIKCIDTRTGKERWSTESDLMSVMFLIYNQTYYFESNTEGLECYSVLDKSLLWSIKKPCFIRAFNDEFLFATTMEDLRTTNDISVLDIKTGEVVTQIMDIDYGQLLVNGNDVYVIQKTKITKYSKSINTPCDAEAYWVDSNKVILDATICPHEPISRDLKIVNSSEDKVLHFKLDCSTKNLSVNRKRISLGPGQSETISARYLASKVDEDSPTCSVKVLSSCGFNIELKLNLSKEQNCHEILRKKFELNSQEYHLVGKVMVLIDETEDHDFIGIRGVSCETGETLWEKTSNDMGNTNRCYVHGIEGNLVFVSITIESGEFWYCIDAETGKVVYKRNDGDPFLPNRRYVLDTERYKDKTVNFFNLTTGKNVISKLKFDSYTEINSLCQVGNRFFFENASNKIFCCDSKGKVYWTENVNIFTNPETNKTNSLYLSSLSNKDAEGENDFADCEIARANPDNLKTIWSAKIVGHPSVLKESKQKVWIKSLSGVYCFENNTGKLVWKLADDKYYWRDPLVIGNNFCIEQYYRDDIETEEYIHYLVVYDMETGKQVAKIKMKNWFRKVYVDNCLFATDFENVSNGAIHFVHCIDTETWKELWMVSGEDTCEIGNRTIFVTRYEGFSWFEDGKRVGFWPFEERTEDEENNDNMFFRDKSIEWFGDTVIVYRDEKITAIDAKTSRMKWQYDGDPVYSKTNFIYIDEKFDQERKFVVTPYIMNNLLFAKEDGNLVVYDVIK